MNYLKIWESICHFKDLGSNLSDFWRIRNSVTKKQKSSRRIRAFRFFYFRSSTTTRMKKKLHYLGKVNIRNVDLSTFTFGWTVGKREKNLYVLFLTHRFSTTLKQITFTPNTLQSLLIGLFLFLCFSKDLK